MAAVNRVRPLAVPAVMLMLIALSLVACAPMRTGYSDLPRLRVAVRLGLENLCAGSQSPPIALQNVPAGTARYRFRMSNMSVLMQTPSEWTIPVPDEPSLIPIGALAGYSGPCPGEFQRFNYRMEVLALDAQGRPSGFGAANMQVASVNRMAQEAWRRAGKSEAADPTLAPVFDDELRDVFPYSRDRDIDVFYGDRARDRDLRRNEPIQPGVYR